MTWGKLYLYEYYIGAEEQGSDSSDDYTKSKKWIRNFLEVLRENTF
jgi:hypothetical protein